MMSVKFRRIKIVLLPLTALVFATAGCASHSNSPEQQTQNTQENQFDLSPAAPIDKTSDDLHAYFVSSWEGFSSLEIKNRDSFIAYGVAMPPETVVKKATEVADPFPVEYQLGKVQMKEYEKRTDLLLEQIGSDRDVIRQIMLTDGDAAVYVELVDAKNVGRVESLLREVFAGLPLEIKKIPLGSGPVIEPMAGRWSDASPFYSGAEIHWGTDTGCTSAFSAERNSDRARVVVTAWHCNNLNLELGDFSPRTWKTGSSNVVIGKSSSNPNVGYPSGLADAMYILKGSGTTFGSGMCVGGWKSSNYKTRKSVGNPTSVGQEIRMGGAYSGGSTGYVTKLNVVVPNSGKGFYWRDGQYEASQGAGDSGAPAYTANADGTYSGRGMLLAKGQFQDSFGSWQSAAWENCSQGDTSRGASCSTYIFALNVAEIESKLDVDIYSS